MLETILDKQFDIGVVRNPDSSLFTDFSSQSNLEKVNMRGKHVWLNAMTPNVLRRSIIAFSDQRMASDLPTSACVLTSDANPLGHMTRGWRVVHRVPKGSRVQRVLSDGSIIHGTAKRTLKILYCAPKPTLKRKAESEEPESDDTAPDASLCAAAKSSSLRMLFGCKAAGSEANILFDSGATHNFVTAEFCRTHGVVIEPKRSSVLLPDNVVANDQGEAHVYVELGSFRERISCLVMTQLLPGVDVLIGNSFMDKHRVDLSYDKKRVTLKKGKRHITVASKPPYRDRMPDDNKSEPKLLSAMQVRRLVRKRRPVYLGLVTSLSDPEDLGTTSSAPDLDPWVKKLIADYDDVFKDPLPPGLPPDRGAGHSIPTEPGHQPPFRPMYRLSPLEFAEAQKQVTKFLNDGIIQPSKSPYGAPILFVPKPNGRGLRLCVDYRALNKVTIKNRYPIPRIDDLLDAVAGAKYFTNLDLTSGYHQIRISDEDVPKTAFRTPMGHFEFKVLIEGLTNAPATFQTVMNQIFASEIRKFVVVYLDDILIYSRTRVEHERHVRQALEILRQNHFYVCAAKSRFFQEEIKFLGHIVGKDGIRPDPAKVSAVNEWKTPTDQTGVRSFLGLANYFRKFIQGYANLALPLTELTKKDHPFSWTPTCREAFDGIKEALSNAPVLASPDVTKPYEVISDASGFGLGAVLLQDGKPIAFESRKLTPAERNYTTTEQELLGVIHALNVWRCYLEGVEFTIITDHNPNTFFETQPTLTRRQARWSQFLARFGGARWEYRPGRTNIADPLSRHPVGIVAAITRRQGNERVHLRTGHPPVEAPADSSPRSGQVHSFGIDLPPSLVQLIAEAGLRDPFLRDAIKTGSQIVNEQPLRPTPDGIWLWGSRIYVPNSAAVHSEIMRLYHDSPFAGHFGKTKTIKAIERVFYWSSLKVDVTRYVANCTVCQRGKSISLKRAGLLQPLPIPERPWESVSFDLITELPTTRNGHDAIAVFVDRLTKYHIYVPTTTNVSAEGFAELWYANVWKNHGVAKTFVSDRDPRFTSKFWEACASKLGTTLLRSTAFHPETDGSTERANRTLEQYLRMFVCASLDNWDELLPNAQFAYNSSWNESVQSTPFELNFGWQVRNPLGLGSAPAPAANDFVTRIQDGIQRAKTFLRAAQDRQKSFADRNRRDVEYKVGDKVLLSTKYFPIKNPGARKLWPKWIGPFEITQRIGQVAYRLALPDSVKVHPVFHVSLLAPYRSDGRVQPPPPPLDIEGVLEYEVDQLLAHRDKRVRRNVLTTEYLVHWKGYDQSHNTWEPEAHLKNCQHLLDEYWQSLHERTVAGLARRKQMRERTKRARTN